MLIVVCVPWESKLQILKLWSVNQIRMNVCYISFRLFYLLSFLLFISTSNPSNLRLASVQFLNSWKLRRSRSFEARHRSISGQVLFLKWNALCLFNIFSNEVSEMLSNDFKGTSSEKIQRKNICLGLFIFMWHLKSVGIRWFVFYYHV